MRRVERLAVEAIGVSKRYGDRGALQDVSVFVPQGRLHGLLGPNGAGKTTLMRILLGLIRRDAGTVRLLGHDLDSTGGPLRAGIAGFVDSPAFYPYLTGRQNLTLLARLDRTAFDRSNVTRVLEQVGLDRQGDHVVRSYSTGMRQRLGLAAALLRSPELLVLDEPTSSLDPAGARDIRTLAEGIAERGTAVLFSSHDMIEVEELCETLTVLNHGRVVFSGSVAELRARAPGTMHALRTSDDSGALGMAAARRGVRVVPGAESGLEVTGELEALDAYVIALGNAGIAVRSLEHRARSLESLFLELTNHPDPPLASALDAHHLADDSHASVVAS
jgi:ABC-2 type transport system ATP-binding protein